MKRGTMFYAFIVATVVCSTAGFWGYFKPIISLIVLAFCGLCYLIYWLMINFTNDLKTFISRSFILLGAVLGVQLFILCATYPESFWTAISTKTIMFIGVQHINTTSIYFLVSMGSCFYLGYKHKYDYLFCLLAVVFAVFTYFTYARMATLVCFIFMMFGLIFLFTKSKNKPIFLYIGLAGILALGALFGIFYEKIIKLFSWHLKVGLSGNGRDILWPWCLEKFLDSPIFGVGFVSDDPVPTLLTTDSIILAHNSLIQYLTSVGIVGTLFIAYFYVKKYITLCKNFNTFKFFNLLQILMIAIPGVVDQCETMDIFIILISITFIALAEIDTSEIPRKENKNEELKTKKITKKQQKNNA